MKVVSAPGGLGFAIAVLFAALASLPSPACAQVSVPELSYAFRLQGQPEPRLTIEARFRGGPEGFTVLGWCLSDWPDAPDCGGVIRDVTVRSEASGKVLPLDHPEPGIWTCDHAPGEPLFIQSELAPQQGAGAGTALVPVVSAEYVMFLADTALLVPEHLVRQSPTAIRYTWDGPLPAGWTTATSFAVTDRDKTVHLPVATFLQSLFFWGAVQLHEASSPAGPPLRVAWLRATPAQQEREAVLSRLVSVRDSVARYLHGEVDRTVTWFVLPAAPGRVSALTLTASILLLADVKAIAETTEKWARWALTAAHEAVHTSPAGRIRLTAAPVPANFLNEALAEFIARRALFRAGLIGARDWAEVVSAKLTGQPPAAGVAGSPDPYVTGDLLMVLLDTEIRRVSGGKADILSLVDELLRQPQLEGGAGLVSWQDFRAALARLTSAPFAEELDALLQQRRKIRVSADLFAGCLQLKETPVWAFDPGFDVERSIEGNRVAGVRQGGAAWAAGLRDGEALLEWSIQWNRSDVPVRFLVATAGAPRAVSYLPRGSEVLSVQQELVPEPVGRRCADVL